MITKLTMRELQKISAAKIRALPHSVPIKSGDETVAVLVPIRAPSPEVRAEVFANLDAVDATRSPEEKAEIETFLAEIGEA